jgi:hypothetical protein
VRRLEGAHPILQLAHLEQLRPDQGGMQESTRLGDRALDAQQVEHRDLDHPLQVADGPDPAQLVGAGKGAFPASAQSSQPAGLGHLLGPLGVVHQAVALAAQGRRLAQTPVRHRERAAAVHHSSALVKRGAW